MLARISARPPSWSFRWNLTAPQQPASAATTVWMPAASSTRAVALLMLGIMAGCTQPASISTLRACAARGPGCRRPAWRGTLFLQRGGQQRAHQLAQLHGRARTAARAGLPSAPSAARVSPARARHLGVDQLAADVDQVAVLHAAGAGAFAVAAGQAAVQVQLGLARGRARLRAPASSGRCGRAGRRARRPAAGRWGRWRCRSRSARTCAGWPRPPGRRACP